MNGVHDMGGMHGFGPVPREENEPVFHEPWEGRVYGLVIATGPQRLIPGGLRESLESLEPAKYLSSSYYERWMLVLERALLETGVVSAEELEARTDRARRRPRAALPRRRDPAGVEQTLERIFTRRSPRRDVGVAPRFRVGDAVRARNVHPAGHTRLPRYARGKAGAIARVHGVYAFHDAPAPGFKAGPQAVYSVRFDARELWGESAETHMSVYIDMWESYLEPRDPHGRGAGV